MVKSRVEYSGSGLKSKSFEEIQKLYKKEQQWINDFVPMSDDSGKKDDSSSKQAESSKKRPRAEHDEESVKKQKLQDDAEKEELRACLDIVQGDDIAIDVESLATKYPIVDWKTHILTENMMYYQIIRADGSSKNYKIFSEMLDDFDRQDVMDLHRLVKERYDITSPEGYDLLLWGDLKTLFEPCEEDEVWRNQQGYNLIRWRLFDSCGVHVFLMDNGIAIHMMIEKKYPLTQEMLSRILNRRLKVDHESEMTFELLGFICLGVDLEPDEWIKDSGCSKHMTGNRKLFSTYKAYNGGNVIFGSNLCGNIIGKVSELEQADCHLFLISTNHECEVDRNALISVKMKQSLLRDLDAKRLRKASMGFHDYLSIAQYEQSELVDVFDHEMSSFLFQVTPPSLWQVRHVRFSWYVLERKKEKKPVKTVFDECTGGLFLISVLYVMLGDVESVFDNFNSNHKFRDLCLCSRRRICHSRDYSLKILEIIVDEELEWLFKTNEEKSIGVLINSSKSFNDSSVGLEAARFINHV
ncbi:hypothetical protein Tco_0002130 [Tanacetum coccineum]